MGPSLCISRAVSRLKQSGSAPGCSPFLRAGYETLPYGAVTRSALAAPTSLCPQNSVLCSSKSMNLVFCVFCAFCGSNNWSSVSSVVQTIGLLCLLCLLWFKQLAFCVFCAFCGSNNWSSVSSAPSVVQTIGLLCLLWFKQKRRHPVKDTAACIIVCYPPNKQIHEFALL